MSGFMDDEKNDDRNTWPDRPIKVKDLKSKERIKALQRKDVQVMPVDKEWKVTKFDRDGTVSLEQTLNELEKDGWATATIVSNENEGSLDIVSYWNVSDS